MKVHIICYVTAELPNVGKTWFLRYGSKYFWPIKLRDSSKCKISRKKWGIKLHGFCFPPTCIGWHNFKIFEIFHGRKKSWKYGRRRNLDRGRCQEGVIDSNLTFSSEFYIIYHGKKIFEKGFFIYNTIFLLGNISTYMHLMDSKDVVYSIQYLWEKQFSLRFPNS